jgi:hypothetical protein
MELKDDKWWWSGPELLIYAAVLVIGVPLSMRELWQLGRETEVFGLASLWLPTVLFLGHDFLNGYVSRGSIFCFICWVGVVGYVAYSHAV